MGRIIGVFTWLLLLSLAAASPAYPFVDDFESNSGEIVWHGGWDESNWIIGEAFGLEPRMGEQFLLAATGPGEIASDVGFTLTLDHTIHEDLYAYLVFFRIAKFGGLAPVEPDDFSSLHIGGRLGEMWELEGPIPSTDGVWVEWTGVYVPAEEEIGEPFVFEVILDMEPATGIAIDGPLIIDPWVPVDTGSWSELKRLY